MDYPTLPIGFHWAPRQEGPGMMSSSAHVGPSDLHSPTTTASRPAGAGTGRSHATRPDRVGDAKTGPGDDKG